MVVQVGHGVAQRPRRGIMFKHQVNHCACGLGVGVESIIHAIVTWHLLQFGIGVRIIALGYQAHDALDAVLDAIHIYVAHNDDCLPLGAIPALIEGEQLSAAHVAYDGHVTNGNAISIAAPG